MASMKRHILWIAAALVLVAVPAVIAVLVIGDDERRLGAAGETSTGALHVRLELGGTQFGVWRKATWGIDLDVIEQKTTDAEGNPAINLAAGRAKGRALVLEHGWSTGGGTSDFLQAVTTGQTYKSATATVVDYQGQPVATYELSGVLVAFLEHEITGDAVERIGLRYESIAFSS